MYTDHDERARRMRNKYHFLCMEIKFMTDEAQAHKILDELSFDLIRIQETYGIQIPTEKINEHDI